MNKPDSTPVAAIIFIVVLGMLVIGCLVGGLFFGGLIFYGTPAAEFQEISEAIELEEPPPGPR